MPQPEVWMRGPVANVPSLLQPVAHALLQAGEELPQYLHGFDDKLLWVKPAGLASVGFHLLHICGVIDRLFTYAQEKTLTDAQLEYLKLETAAQENNTSAALLQAVQLQIANAVEQLKNISENELAHTRYLGRKKISVTLMGLLFHAAEHTQRHVGQLLVTAKISEQQRYITLV